MTLCYSFYGGRSEVGTDGTISAKTNFVSKYSWRYGSTYYPQSPVELICDSTLALETSLATLDIKGNDLPFTSGLEMVNDIAVPRFETRDFILAHSFKTSQDAMENGLNSSSTGAPIEINLEFGANPNATSSKEIITFIQQTNTLYIKPNGDSSIVM
jgi:hypothetical protein